MKNRSPRIFLGMVDTAGIGSSMALAFRQMGHKAMCYSDKRPTYTSTGRVRR